MIAKSRNRSIIKSTKILEPRKHFSEIGIYHANTGSCNACDIEVIATLLSLFDIKKFGCKLMDTPDKAKILTITGPVTMKIADDLRGIYRRIQEPKCVIAVGTCAISKGVFNGGYSVIGPVDELFPVDVYIPGCPPRPQSIVKGILLTLEKLGIEKIPYESAPAPEGFRGKPEYDPEKCTGCGACAVVCPAEAITVAEKDGKEILKLYYGKCTFCAKCEEDCPENAIHLTKAFEMASYTKETIMTGIEIDEAKCERCGRLIGPVPQLKKIVNTMQENDFLPQENLAKFEKNLKLCQRCKKESLLVFFGRPRASAS